VCLVEPAGAKEIKIKGYVTNIVSPTVFEIEDYRITRDVSLVLEFEKDEEGGNVEFHPEELRVGTLLEIKGDYDEKTGELRAKSIKVILEEFKKIKRAALIEHRPTIERGNSGWVGTFFADGQSIQVDPSTQVLFKLTKSEQQLQKKEKKELTSTQNPSDEEGFSPLMSLDQVTPNTFMSYQGLRLVDGSIRALRVEFQRNEMEKGEAKTWKGLKTSIKPPSFVEGKPGELKIAQVGKYKLVPSEEAQRYIRELGDRLVPAYQKSLPAGDPQKIPFQFFLVEKKEINAFALPNGIVVIYSSMFKVLENEAQLAAVMGHEISHAIQEHYWRQHEYHKKKLMALKIGAAVGSIWGGRAVTDIANLIEGAVRNGYARSLENQADRAGLEYMLDAGYDIREAPRVWKQMTKELGDQPTNFFWSNHDNNTTRRSYLMSELRMNYSNVDYSKLEKKEEPYRKVVSLVNSATLKTKIKVKH
jgi:Zn-dependent protease with chaperone function